MYVCMYVRTYVRTYVCIYVFHTLFDLVFMPNEATFRFRARQRTENRVP